MKFRVNKPALAALAIGMLAAVQAYAQSSVTFGRITHVRQVQVEDQGARAAGTLVGGALGVASGSGHSRSNRALRGLGGAAVGSRAAGAMSRSTAFEYTVLVDGTSTIRMVTDTAGLARRRLRRGRARLVQQPAHGARRALRHARPGAGMPRAPSRRPACRPRTSSSMPRRTRTSTAPSAACGCSATTNRPMISRRGAG